jgi:GTP cyclohydrolase I
MCKKEYFEAIKEIVAESGVENVEDIISFCDKEIAAIEAKAAKAAERRAEKQAEGDALRAKIYDVITDELQTADAITEQVADGDESITKAKVVARLTQLIKSGVVAKDYVKEDSRKVTAYKLA